MPPQISDEELSASETEIPIQIKQDKKEPKATKVQDEEKVELKVESDKEDEDEDGDEEGVYVVEKIIRHIISEEGEIHYEVKWEGYEDIADRTMEPEENLETASEILQAYWAKHGGKEKLLEAFKEKKNAKGGKKRGRTSTTAAQPENGVKRGRKSNGAAKDATPPKGADFKPPTGNWEDEVVQIDACEGAEGAIVVYLTWKGGQKSQHPLAQVYKRCPQQMLKFYESHLVFKKNDESEAA